MKAQQFRFEAKYLLNPSRYWKIRCALSMDFILDPYTAAAANGRYFVRSLYFDSENYQAYFEKVVGENRRIKLRLRTYGCDADEAPAVKLELKRRQGKLIQKDSESISYEQYLKFADTNFRFDDLSPLRDEFCFHIERADLKPKVLVDYHREAFVSRTDRNIRLTFDHQIRYGEADRLFPDRCFFRSDLARNIVLEIKSGKDDDPILSELVKCFDLMSVPNSKYANAIEHTQSSIWH